MRTFAMIKPDAVAGGHAGKIIDRILAEKFEIIGLKKLQASRAQVEGFYAVHKERPFFDELCTFMCSGPIYVIALERDNAVTHWRDVIGATDPAEAADGTIRKQFAKSKGENAAHGSDSEENGRIEVAYWFSETELV